MHLQSCFICLAFLSCQMSWARPSGTSPCKVVATRILALRTGSPSPIRVAKLAHQAMARAASQIFILEPAEDVVSGPFHSFPKKWIVDDWFSAVCSGSWNMRMIGRPTSITTHWHWYEQLKSCDPVLSGKHTLCGMPCFVGQTFLFNP